MRVIVVVMAVGVDDPAVEAKAMLPVVFDEAT